MGNFCISKEVENTPSREGEKLGEVTGGECESLIFWVNMPLSETRDIYLPITTTSETSTRNQKRKIRHIIDLM